MNALFYGGPRHNKVCAVLDNEGMVVVAAGYRQKPGTFTYFSGLDMTHFVYHRKTVKGRWEEKNMCVDALADVFVLADKTKKFEPEKILRLAVRRKVAQVERTMLY